jgi:hypothetical protein
VALRFAQDVLDRRFGQGWGVWGVVVYRDMLHQGEHLGMERQQILASTELIPFLTK